ncbi:MAG: aminopeptidase P family protein [Pseudomonadota bacterium]
MFKAEVYVERRKKLKKLVGSGVILLWGNNDMPMNYNSNPYHFRQNSTFLYFFGLDSQGLSGLIDIDNDKDMLFGNDFDIDDIIWMGPQKTLSQRALDIGIDETYNFDQIGEKLEEAKQQKRKVHFIPPYRMDNMMRIETLLDIHHKEARDFASIDLIKAIIELRSVKSDDEIIQMEEAHDITRKMFLVGMRRCAPGAYESRIAGQMEGVALSLGGMISFPVIATINGEILHNHYHGNQLKDGDLLLIDAGAENSFHYAADISRTIPVSGKFTQKQKDIYSIVLKANEEAIKLIRPGLPFKNVHIAASKIITEGLIDLGYMKGSAEDAVSAGAHALFFPHGLGHMLGIDAHDMENLGEDYIGYDETVQRSDQFGLAYLRLARKLQKGFVVTIEPGIYFIQTLIKKFKEEGKFLDFVNYDKVFEDIGFGGIRIEDDVLVTEDAYRVIGKRIPKTVNEIEGIVGW